MLHGHVTARTTPRCRARLVSYRLRRRGRWFIGPEPAPADGFVVDWQLAGVAGPEW